MVICALPGVVLAAAYILRMLQRVVYGGVRNPPHAGIVDLSWRETLTLAPLLVMVFWIGLHPQPITRVLHASIERLVEQTSTAPHTELTRHD
jgi:NADH-quinone oxidoreductase subunit M